MNQIYFQRVEKKKRSSSAHSQPLDLY